MRTKHIAAALALLAPCVGIAATVNPTVDLSRDILLGLESLAPTASLPEGIAVVRYESDAEDPEPLYAVTVDERPVAFFRAGAEQCYDKVAGQIPCGTPPDVYERLTGVQKETTDVFSGLTRGVPSYTTVVDRTPGWREPGTGYTPWFPGGGGTVVVPKVPDVVPPVSPVPLPGAVVFVLGAIGALAMIGRKKL